MYLKIHFTQIFGLFMVVLGVASRNSKTNSSIGKFGQSNDSSNISEDCVWERKTDFPKISSLLIEPKTLKIIAPTMDQHKKVIRVIKRSSVVVACPDSTISSFKGKEVVKGVCSGGKTLKIENKDYGMKDLGCIVRPKSSINKNIDTTGEICGKGRQLHSIGFKINGFDFYDLIKVCFDNVLETTVMTSHTINGASVTSKDQNPTRPSFEDDKGFYTVNPNICYDQDSQIALMKSILGNSSAINIKNTNYFARGHLSPDSDFFTEGEADATYYYLNVAPQWQSFNNGNWKHLENSIREKAAKDGGKIFKIWTGPLGILTLDNNSGKPVKIYLGLTQQKKVIPVPELFWKVIYEPSTNLGVAVIGVNNPYIKTFPKKLCLDVCDSISWINFDTMDFAKGAMYCCDIQSFHKAVPMFPSLNNPKLLK